MNAREIRAEIRRLDDALRALLLAGKRYSPDGETINRQYCALVDRLAAIEHWPDFSMVERPRRKHRAA